MTEARFPVYYVCGLTDRGLQAVMHGGAVDTAYAWDGALKDYGELSRLRPAQIVVDYEKTDAMLRLGARSVRRDTGRDAGGQLLVVVRADFRPDYAARV